MIHAWPGDAFTSLFRAKYKETTIQTVFYSMEPWIICRPGFLGKFVSHSKCAIKFISKIWASEKSVQKKRHDGKQKLFGESTSSGLSLLRLFVVSIATIAPHTVFVEVEELLRFILMHHISCYDLLMHHLRLKSFQQD